ncbi:hypothetical protein BU15DRAFT_71850 [Melanogaster broomeanus]|nr:hypothetical protein BU15DRAFT_71850 [Melanogaster broomeanus]
MELSQTSLWTPVGDPGSLQIILQQTRQTPKTMGSEYSAWSNSLVIPLYAAGISALLLFLPIVFSSYPARAVRIWLRITTQSKEHSVAISQEGLDVSIDQPPVSRLGGPAIYGFKLARFLGCLAFLGLSLVTPSREAETVDHAALWQATWPKLAVCVTASYTCLLGLLSIAANFKRNRIVSQHLAIVLLVTFSTYAYRDLYPLMTFTKKPEDLYEGKLLWAKVAILAVVAVIIPLASPRQYIPSDPANPSEFPHPEQTSSWFSMLLYFWLDPIVFMAQRMSHLPHEKLPPLADHDHSRNLKNRAFPHLDAFTNKKTQHVFFGLMRAFRMEYIELTILLVFRVITTLSAPIGVNYLLAYLENGGEGETVRPWVWIVWIFCGQSLSSVLIQRCVYITTRTMVRAECIVTQLVFEHALRIRMKAEVPDVLNSVDSISTPDSASVSESSTVVEGTDLDEAQSSSRSTLASSTAKGKQNARKQSSDVDTPAQKSMSNSANMVGKINNLVTTDLGNIVEGRDFLQVFPYCPLQVGCCIWFLYRILGWRWAALAPLPYSKLKHHGLVARKIRSIQKEKMNKTDERVQVVTETMSVLRMVKLFGWETKMEARINEKRDVELAWTWKFRMCELINNVVTYFMPLITMMACYSTYTGIMGKELTASRVFSSMTVFDILKDQLEMVLRRIPQIIQGKLSIATDTKYLIPFRLLAMVSMDRVNDFLNETELLDEFTTLEEGSPQLFAEDHIRKESDLIGFRDAVFAWSNEGNTGMLTPSKHRFNLRIDDEVFFKRGCINLIIGPTGAGKTSMLMALLGEMHFMPSGPTSWFNLPRKGGVAYAAQESWVQNETIKDNILFGAPYDEVRYKKVIHQCALERDLELFEAGDRTEVGERGLTLSGGQKARITLARAVYSSAEILLLDDVLAALDVHTAKWIVDKCLAGDILRHRTVILVTHNVAMASTVAQYVVSLNSNGRVISQGTLSEAIAHDDQLAAEMAKEQEILQQKGENSKSSQPSEMPDKGNGKLILSEEILAGHVSWSAFKLYLSNVGGGHATLFWIAFTFLMGATNVIVITQAWFLGHWASQYDLRPASEVNIGFYLTIYGLLLLLSCCAYTPGYTLYNYGALRASRTIHHKLLNAVLGTTLRWLDTTPTSRVITRCTQDIRAVDGPFAMAVAWVTELSLLLLFRLGAVVLLTPAFLVPGILVGIVGHWLGRTYMKAQIAVKREMSIAKAPVVGHFHAAITGLTSIRAYGAQKSFQESSLNRLDRYTKTGRVFYNLNRWVSVRLELVGALFTTALATYLVYGRSRDASNVGFSLNMTVGFSSLILNWVRTLNEVEVSGNSIERINSYINIEQEPKPTEGGAPPAYWPASGKIVVENLSARYSSDGPQVLHNLNFTIESGERVGVVGHTGSGKSSLTLSLLRCIPTEGTVYFDGIPTSGLNLDSLRANVTIIPQIPELLSGTLRQNLDPFDQHDDATLNDALRAAGLFAVQEETDDGRLTLDSPIASGGGNLSVGQRQILALARAMVRGSKLLILDEATSAIDYKTDTAIQSSLRNEMRDVTQIIIAHRLQTIIDAEKIIVLDAGNIVEFGSPKELLQKEKGMLKALVDESGDRDLLYGMAK